MIVNGKEVSIEIIAACLDRMKLEPFTAAEIEGICGRMGLNDRDGTAMRAADRLIQRERKAGNIELTNRPYWFWVGDEKQAAPAVETPP